MVTEVTTTISSFVRCTVLNDIMGSWTQIWQNKLIYLNLLFSEMIPKWPTGCFRLLPRDIATSNMSVTEMTRKSETCGQVKTSFYLRPTGELRDAMAWIHKCNSHLPRACYVHNYSGTIVRKTQIDILRTRVGDIAFYPKLGHKITQFWPLSQLLLLISPTFLRMIAHDILTVGIVTQRYIW